MKKYVAAIIFVSLLLVSFGTVAAAPASPAFMMNGKAVQEKPLLSKGEYYFQTGTLEKWFGVKIASDTKKKKAKLTVNKKQVQLDLLVSNKKNYVAISKIAPLFKYSVRFDKAANTYFIIKPRSASEVRMAVKEARQNNNLALMQEIVLSGAKFDINEAMFLTSTNNGIEMAKYLISQGADVNYIHPISKNQAVTNAIVFGFEDYAVELIRLGADVNYRPMPRWNTNLLSAVSEQLPRVVEELLKYGADPNEGLDGNYDTPLERASSKVHYSKSNAQGEVIESGVKMPNLDIVATLLRYGASPKNDDSLSSAIHAGDAMLVEMLLQAGADPMRSRSYDVNLMERYGVDPNSEIGQLLIKYGATIPYRYTQ